MKKINLIFTLIAVLAISFTSCNGGEKKQTSETTAAEVVETGLGQSAVKDTVSAANVLQVAQSLDDFKTLVIAVKAAGVEDALVNAGPLTVFAPVNAAFDKLPAGTVETLLKPENVKLLQTILTYHVVAGKINKSDILKAIKKGNGKAMMTTVSGGTLTAWMKGKDLYITDENGNSSMITITDVNQKNGVIHVVDTVVLPKS